VRDKKFESTSSAFIKAKLLKLRDESDSQSLIKVLYHQKPLQIVKVSKKKFLLTCLATQT